MDIKRIIGLGEEAWLLDSHLYILKSAVAIATGYFLGKLFPIAHIDMISVLLGVMYNLEPFNTMGIRNGISQIVASTVGAACTTLLIVFFGINGVTVALSMALTLYVGLKINWRMVSPVAIFTCIYMTQFVQSDVFGNPSPWLTFRVRIVALTLGVLIALFYNYIFSFIYFRKIAYKRAEFGRLQVLKGMDFTVNQLRSSKGIGREYITVFPGIFDDLDNAFRSLELMKSETHHFFTIVEEDQLEEITGAVKNLRDMNHVIYDINFTLNQLIEPDGVHENSCLEELIEIRNRLDQISFLGKKWKKKGTAKIHDGAYLEAVCENRIQQDLRVLAENVVRIEKVVETLE